jgi:hypothetical protein
MVPMISLGVEKGERFHQLCQTWRDRIALQLSRTENAKHFGEGGECPNGQIRNSMAMGRVANVKRFPSPASHFLSD